MLVKEVRDRALSIQVEDLRVQKRLGDYDSFGTDDGILSVDDFLKNKINPTEEEILYARFELSKIVVGAFADVEHLSSLQQTAFQRFFGDYNRFVVLHDILTRWCEALQQSGNSCALSGDIWDASVAPFFQDETYFVAHENPNANFVNINSYHTLFYFMIHDLSDPQSYSFRSSLMREMPATRFSPAFGDACGFMSAFYFNLDDIPSVLQKHIDALRKAHWSANQMLQGCAFLTSSGEDHKKIRLFSPYVGIAGGFEIDDNDQLCQLESLARVMTRR